MSESANNQARMVIMPMTGNPNAGPYDHGPILSRLLARVRKNRNVSGPTIISEVPSKVTPISPNCLNSSKSPDMIPMNIRLCPAMLRAATMLIRVWSKGAVLKFSGVMSKPMPKTMAIIQPTPAIIPMESRGRFELHRVEPSGVLPLTRLESTNSTQ